MDSEQGLVLYRLRYSYRYSGMAMSEETKHVLFAIAKWVGGIGATLITIAVVWMMGEIYDHESRISSLETADEIHHN
jgi:hypothetical protein